MAFIPYFAFGPTSFLGLIGLLYGADPTIPTPRDDWRNATFDLLIPTYNEEKTIVLCLSSIARQTLKPRQIFLFDDGSQDNTIQYAQYFAKQMDLNLKVLKRDHNEGKTPSVYFLAHESDADVVGIVDGDTVLRSDNYLERIVQELYQGVGIASSCGLVLPLAERDRDRERNLPPVQAFSKLHPEVEYTPDKTRWQLAQRGLTNAYREELYLFLERYIYRGEMVFFGSLIFPIGCAVVYRRKYLKEIFDEYFPVFGYDLTTSEDIFFGFAFAKKGYRNINVQDVYALTLEPRFSRFYHQIFKWSSSFLQSCYYFNSVFYSPFKFPWVLIKKYRDKRNAELQKMIEKRRVKEAYRQAFGAEYTDKYGRNIGWFVFTTALEKMSYPTVLLILIILRYWETLLITIGAEVTIYTIIILLMHKNRRIRNFFKAILFSTIRYSQIMFDLVVIGRFITDVWITKNRNWRK